MKLKEVTQPKASNREQTTAYSAIVKARKLWQNSIVSSQKEYYEEQAILNKKMLVRTRDKEGEIVSPQNIYDNRMKFMISNRQNIQTLQALQTLERKLMNALGASIGILPADTMQDITFFIPNE